jgi:hypothetical protein
MISHKVLPGWIGIGLRFFPDGFMPFFYWYLSVIMATLYIFLFTGL